MMKTPMHANNREALELFKILKERLNLPDNIVEFTLHFKHDDLITVTCMYYPKRIENEQNRSSSN